MSAIAAFRSGDLQETLSALSQEVRAAPEDPKHRIFLFQLLALMGDWDRALTQLNVVRELDSDAMLMAQTYQEVLRCEALRAQVFQGQRSPMLFGEPQEWMAQAIEAHKLVAAGDLAAAKELRDQAWDAAPTSAGTATIAKPDPADGQAEVTETIDFEWIAGEGGMELGPKWNEFESRLGIPPCPFGIIAGRTDGLPANPLVDGEGDFVVSIDETRLEGATDFLEVPQVHSFLMDDVAVQQATIRFLREGKFR